MFRGKNVSFMVILPTCNLLRLGFSRFKPPKTPPGFLFGKIPPRRGCGSMGFTQSLGLLVIDWGMRKIAPFLTNIFEKTSPKTPQNFAKNGMLVTYPGFLETIRLHFWGPKGLFSGALILTFDPINGFFSWDPDQPPREDHLAMCHGGKKKNSPARIPQKHEQGNNCQPSSLVIVYLDYISIIIFHIFIDIYDAGDWTNHPNFPCHHTWSHSVHFRTNYLIPWSFSKTALPLCDQGRWTCAEFSSLESDKITGTCIFSSPLFKSKAAEPNLNS